MLQTLTSYKVSDCYLKIISLNYIGNHKHNRKASGSVRVEFGTNR